MDKITNFKYSYGRLNEIKEGNLPRMELSSEMIGHFFREQPKSVIMVPELIGIYQISSLKFDGEFENECGNVEKEIFKKLSEYNQETFKELLRTVFGKKDSSHSELIGIIYDSMTMPGEIARAAFNDELGRIRFFDFRNTPHFYDKNTAQLSFFMDKFAKQKRSMGEVLEEDKKAAEDACIRLNNQMIKYGLTREEYAFFEIMDNMKKGEQKASKIIITKSLDGLKDPDDFFKKK